MKRSMFALCIGALVVLLAACATGVTPGAVEPNSISYALDPVGESDVDGIITFEKISETETLVTIEVDGLDAGSTYPAHIHAGDFPDGPIVLSFEPVDGATGTSVTTVTQLDNGTAVDYEYLVNYDGFAQVHAPGGTPVLATGEVGAGGEDVQVNL